MDISDPNPSDATERQTMKAAVTMIPASMLISIYDWLKSPDKIAVGQ